MSGVTGDVAYAAVPVEPTLAERVRLHLGPHPVVVLTRQIGSLGPSWTYLLIVIGATLLAAVAVAWRLGVRISRPLERAAEATRRIAQGDLGARVTVGTGDFPELVSLAESINSMGAGLARSQQVERELLLSVTHDLRTPLTSIRGYAEAIADGARLIPRKQQTSS